MRLLTVNAGSSSIKLTVFDVDETPKRFIEAVIQNIGQHSATLITKGDITTDNTKVSVVAPDHKTATEILQSWLSQQGIPGDNVSAVGHRIVHGGPKYYKPCVIDDTVLADLRELILFDPGHLPLELELIEAFKHMFPSAQHMACFDIAFHHNLPLEARLLPIPRRYEALGIRRYGFHGLSYEFIMEELKRSDSPDLANGRLVLAHLGNGVSLAAVHKGMSIDTTMGLTPASGVPMSTRSGDLDPGVFTYLAHSEGLSSDSFDNMVNTQSGLLGISGITSDMKQLLEQEADDIRAKEAVNLFCYQVKKSIGSLAAVLGGLDALIFTGGMGEQAPKIRARICSGLEFLGIDVEEQRNDNNASTISADRSKVTVRVIHTDEATTIAQNVWQLLTKDRNQ